jgi:pimeloyl-ACP methyl ester carboxylesterase
MLASTLPFLNRGKPEPVRNTFGDGRHKIVYQTYGDVGEPILLVHGLSGSGRWWKNNVRTLSERHLVHVIELVGYGANRAFKPARLAEAAEALAQFIALQPQGKAHVVGHSMGGQVSCLLAAKFPERVDRLVLAAAAGLVRSNIVKMAFGLPIAAHYSPLDFPADARRGRLAGRAAEPVLVHPRHPGSGHDGGGSDDQGPDVARLGRQGQPGTRLDGGGHAETDLRLAAGGAGGAGHVLMWDRAKTFNRLVLDFLEQRPAAPVAPGDERVDEGGHRTAPAG